ncbi:ImmA/IrrE family metallo-endopeptidase [Bacillus sp. UNCCL81]|uniref:ImmA/IrrE family metallo-endopeptidase n=1 Tax=Bacillus sp. UNCCL81 TaxID=1502755 RepID=UPI000472A683|nr:protein of unknown function [Bacillus sp. UNCCL81]
MQYRSIQKKVELILKTYKTNDINLLCEKLNIVIMYSNLKNIKGFLQCYKKHYFIHVNSSVNNKSEVIAHELGHYFLHRNQNVFKLNTVSCYFFIHRISFL